MMSRDQNNEVVNFEPSCEIVEGVRSGNKIKMVPADNYGYCILRGNIPKASFTKN
jgi:hypothetical protein